jgi:lipopolysaccharide transport system ATP-binding protein
MGTITVAGLGKAYRQYPNRWARLAEWLLPGGAARHQLHWVLKDVSFGVRPGEAVGIIGINGAGKSTLLKMITGTSQPTTGSVEISGRVAALLELGMGFHPDFTGRENVVMAGQLLGHNVDALAALMPAIENFAEIGEYMDQPVRVYSSGMQMRLAFSVATAVRPDVLIVDEALSVGDAYFQHKSFDRIRKYRDEGTTLLLVSHEKATIQSICDRAILLNAGRIEMEGAPDAVMDYYNAMLSARENVTVQQRTLEDGKLQTVSGSGEAEILDVLLRDADGRRIEVVSVGQQVALTVRVRARVALPELVVGYLIRDRLGQHVFGTNTHHLNAPSRSFAAGEEREFTFRFAARLGEGNYSISIALHTGDSHVARNYEWRDLAVIFNVVNVGEPQFVGLAWLPPQIDWSAK